MNMDKSLNTEATLSTSPSSASCEETEEFKDKDLDNYSFPEHFDISLPSKIIKAITRVLNRNSKCKHYAKIIRKQSKSIFTSSELPLISLEDYLIRIIQMTETEESILISALIYLDRICNNNANKLALVHYNIHKLLFTAIMVSIKYHNDSHYTNKAFCYIGGIPLKDLNLMEYSFLNLLGYELFISEDFFNKYQNYISNINLKLTE